MDYWQSDLHAAVRTSQRKGYSQERAAGHVKAAIFLLDICDVLWDYFSVQVRYTAFLLVLTHAIRIYHGIPSPEIPTKHLDGFRLFTEPDQLWCLGTEQLEMRQKLRDTQKRSFERCQAQGESLDRLLKIPLLLPPLLSTQTGRRDKLQLAQDMNSGCSKKGNYSCGS